MGVQPSEAKLLDLVPVDLAPLVLAAKREEADLSGPEVVHQSDAGPVPEEVQARAMEGRRPLLVRDPRVHQLPMLDLLGVVREEVAPHELLLRDLAPAGRGVVETSPRLLVLPERLRHFRIVIGMPLGIGVRAVKHVVHSVFSSLLVKPELRRDYSPRGLRPFLEPKLKSR